MRLTTHLLAFTLFLLAVSATLADEPKTADEFSIRAFQHYNEKRLDQAIADMSEAIRLAPSKVGFHQYRGRYLLEQGKLDDAVRDFTKVIDHQNAYIVQGGIERAK